ncbi:hypothetical protein JCGZ_24162 [Jatropha curcas]|uniref:Uncharacterized protein n=1 Tax=Jatropha curcas TaxID=180498 RepID=A0A067K1M5_JATCU|nr:hypothetical protein JCGZ_24162 [Jatropha curcas]
MESVCGSSTTNKFRLLATQGGKIITPIELTSGQDKSFKPIKSSLGGDFEANQTALWSCSQIRLEPSEPIKLSYGHVHIIKSTQNPSSQLDRDSEVSSKPIKPSFEDDYQKARQ